MNTINRITSVLLAAGTAGVASLTATSVIPFDTAFAAFAIIGLGAFALADYARPVKSLRPLAPVLRPTLPVNGRPFTTRRVAAIVERAA